MRKPRASRLHPYPLLAVASLLTIAACGGDGDDDGEPAPEPVETTTSTTSTTSNDTPDQEPSEGNETDLAAARSCLETAGFAIADGDEASTGLTSDMMEGLGIDQILTFDDTAGSKGTIEAYASQTQAELAADGYADSPLGYEVDRAQNVVVKTTGSSDALDRVGACVRGEPVEAAAEVGDGTSDDAEGEASGDDAEDEASEGDSAAESADVTTTSVSDGDTQSPSGDLGAAQSALVDMLLDPTLEEQGVYFDRTCLEDWAGGFSDADAQLFAANGGDVEEPDLSSEAVARSEQVFTCLDLERLSIEYAEEFAADPACVGDAFASIDMQDVVDEGGPSIDVVFRALADAAFDCT